LKNKASNKVVAAWLFCCCVAIFFMVIIGGLTRLTDSGLSIVKWEPLSGAVPPLTKADWQGYFEAYKHTSQYLLMNKDMSLEQFQGIFWLEYLHRLIARLFGTILLLPMIYFGIRRYFDRKKFVKLIPIIIVALLEPVVGWYMVKSGFVARTSVSQYMLMFHLGVAFLLYALIYWYALDIKFGNIYARCSKEKLAKISLGLVGLVYFMVLLGALMAGTHAGFTYNTFPLMDGRLVPNGLYIMQPWWVNHFENIPLIQFQHRLVAIILALTVFWFAYRLVRIDYNNMVIAIPLVLCMVLQVALGISTLYSFGSYADYNAGNFAYNKILYLPVIVAALHQVNALILFTIILRAAHKLVKEDAPHKIDMLV